MAIAARSIIEARIEYLVNNQVCMNVLHYTNPVAYPAENPTLVVPAFLSVFRESGAGSLIDKMSLMQSTDVDYIRCTAQMVYPTRYILFSSEITKAGQGAAPNRAQNVAAVIEKTGELAGRHNVGSFHLGGLDTGEFIGGFLTAEAQLRLEAIALQLKQQIDEPTFATSWLPCIQQKTKIVGSDPPKFEITGSALLYDTYAKDTLRTMRRRTVGLGI